MASFQCMPRLAQPLVTVAMNCGLRRCPLALNRSQNPWLWFGLVCRDRKPPRGLHACGQYPRPLVMTLRPLRPAHLWPSVPCGNCVTLFCVTRTLPDSLQHNAKKTTLKRQPRDGIQLTFTNTPCSSDAPRGAAAKCLNRRADAMQLSCARRCSHRAFKRGCGHHAAFMHRVVQPPSV